MILGNLLKNGDLANQLLEVDVKKEVKVGLRRIALPPLTGIFESRYSYDSERLVFFMMRFVQGNLLEATAEALVNAVNAVGVMGKGIALMFKEAFPANFRA